jgi:hypothetical protein
VIVNAAVGVTLGRKNKAYGIPGTEVDALREILEGVEVRFVSATTVLDYSIDVSAIFEAKNRDICDGIVQKTVVSFADIS